MITLLKEYFWVFFVSMVPLVELRGAVLIGVGMGLELIPTYIVAVIGNMLPVPIILLFAKEVLLWCTHLPKVGGFFQKIWEKGVKGGDKLQEKAGSGYPRPANGGDGGIRTPGRFDPSTDFECFTPNTL